MKRRNKTLSQALVLSFLISSTAFAQDLSNNKDKSYYPEAELLIVNSDKDIIKPELNEVVISSDLETDPEKKEEVVITDPEKKEEVVITDPEKKEEVVITDPEKKKEVVITDPEKKEEVVITDPEKKEEVVVTDPEAKDETLLTDNLTPEELVLKAEELKTELDKKNTEIEDLVQKISELEDDAEEIESLKETIKKREEEISKLVTEIETLLAKAEKNEELEKQLKEKIAGLESELKDAKELLAEKEKEIEENKKEIAEKEANEKELIEKNKELEIANCEKENLIASMTAGFQQQQQMITQQMNMMQMMMMQAMFMSNFQMAPSVTDNYQHLYPLMMMQTMNSMQTSSTIANAAIIGAMNGLGQQNPGIYVGGNMYGGDYQSVTNPAANTMPMVGSPAIPYAHSFAADGNRDFTSVRTGEKVDPNADKKDKNTTKSDVSDKDLKETGLG